ncbi:NBS-LRR-like resistance protein [Panicum miliaceum]|uniref:NBS-LRR-like resistance protein n=1 Tax=Panicum miliaceum TaxID=4540 RepID=A0A3L6PJY1_PANMI|nr:NBS-LRR-like resistance protein [Panicum miliaceum]
MHNNGNEMNSNEDADYIMDDQDCCDDDDDLDDTDEDDGYGNNSGSEEVVNDLTFSLLSQAIQWWHFCSWSAAAGQCEEPKSDIGEWMAAKSEGRVNRADPLMPVPLEVHACPTLRHSGAYNGGLLIPASVSTRERSADAPDEYGVPKSRESLHLLAAILRGAHHLFDGMPTNDKRGLRRHAFLPVHAARRIALIQHNCHTTVVAAPLAFQRDKLIKPFLSRQSFTSSRLPLLLLYTSGEVIGIHHDSLSNMSGMEAALASGLLKVAGDKLVSLIKSEFASITGVKKDLSDLQDIHGEITSWLSLVHHISIETNPRFRWVIKLKDVAYDIDDLVHEVELEAEKHKLWSGSDKNAIVDSLCAKRKSLLFRHKMARKIKDIKGRSKATGQQTLLSDGEESKIPARDQVKNEIVTKLVESKKGEGGCILSIVGLGGSGKSTLAHHICHDNKIKENFKGTIFWVHNEVATSLQNKVATGYIQKCRYLSLTTGTEKVNKDLFDKVRALYVCDGKVSFDKPVKKRFYIRSVVVNNESFSPFPALILKFEYLGYLEIHNVKYKKLSEAISGCWNLQSLHFIDCEGFVTIPESVGRLKKLRTLELNRVYDLGSLPQSVGDCRELQSIQLYSCNKLREIPTSIGKIENLRDLPSTLPCRTLLTLNLSHTNIAMLPQWVTNIGTLECIDFVYCKELVELPKGIANLKRLAVLNIMGCSKLRRMPSGLGQLNRLRKLGLFVIGCGGDDASILELDSLDMISGDMVIRNLKYLKDPDDDIDDFGEQPMNATEDGGENVDASNDLDEFALDDF